MKITSIKEMIHPGVIIGDEKRGWASLVLEVEDRVLIFKTLKHYDPHNVKIGGIYEWSYYRDDSLRGYDLLSTREIALEDLI